MYAKLFTSIYQGTLRGNSHGLLVFTNLLAHCDRNGIADIHPRAIAEEVGLTVDQVKAALDVLESPDDESRSPEEQGRRIVRLDSHRAWGWRVVNYGKYRAIRSEEDRREQNRAAQERFRAKSADVSHGKPLSAHAEAEAEVNAVKHVASNEATRPNGKPSGPSPRVPFQQIVDAYHEILPELPRVEVLTDARKGAIRQRWSEHLPEIDHWRNFFTHVRASRFLMGLAPPSGDKPPFRADLEWLTKAGNFAKIAEGRYHR